jgi:rubrerythrin
MPLPIDFSKLAPQDILDIAAFIEREAQERYEYFADHLARQGNADAAEFFRLMATLEGAHGAQVGARRTNHFAGLPAHLRNVVEWDVEGPALDRDVTRLSIGAAIEAAITSERRARDFFAEALDHLTDERTRAVLAELHRDEQGHILMLEEQRGRLAARA